MTELFFCVLTQSGPMQVTHGIAEWPNSLVMVAITLKIRELI
jgi:hypothetical protein